MEEETSIVHGDFRLDNMIFDPETHQVKAILDWELSTLGNPIADFTYHMMSWKIHDNMHHMTTCEQSHDLL